MAQKRSHSEETELRLLLVKLTDHVLEMKETDRKNNQVLLARLDEIEAEQRLQRLRADGFRKNLDAVLGLVKETTKKTGELHYELIGSADSLGRRINELEKRQKPAPSSSGRG